MLGYHLNFQNLFVRTSTNLNFFFLFPKNHCENRGHACFFLERKKKEKHQRILDSVVL